MLASALLNSTLLGLLLLLLLLLIVFQFASLLVQSVFVTLCSVLMMMG